MASAPNIHDYQSDYEAVALAADLSKEAVEVQEKGAVTYIAVIPTAAIVGTVLPNSRHWTLVNKTQASRVIGTLQLAAGVNPAAGAETAIPLTGNPAVNQGDVLEFQSIHDGTGLVDPGGLVRIGVTRGNVSA